MDTVKIEISGQDPAAVRETYERIEMMFEVVDDHQLKAEPGRRFLEVRSPTSGRGWVVEPRPHDGARPAALLIHGPAGRVFVPLNEVQLLREALAEAAARLAALEAEARLNVAEGKS